MLRNRDLDAWDRSHFFHPLTHMSDHAHGRSSNRIVEGGEGVHIVDRDGRRYLDGFAGLYCVNIGYGRTKVAEAIAEQARKLAYYHAYMGHGTEASITLARMVAERTPPGLDHVFFGLSGSDANDTQIKLVWYYNNVLDRPEKKKIISRWRAYHGSGVFAGSLTGLPLYHRAFDLPRERVLHTDPPYYLHREDPVMGEADYVRHLAERLEALIVAEGPDTVAAFIGEPLLATGGIIPPPPGYWQAIQAVLDKYDVLLICDEVITGFGRLGTMFGCQPYAIEPDLMTIAKGLTSAYAPLSGVVVSDRVWKVLEQGSERFGPIGHGWTYAAHPIGAAAGIANLEVLDELDLIANCRDVGAYFRTALAEALADHPLVAEVRGEGLLAAVELMADKDDRKPFDPQLKVGPRMAAAALDRGVIIRAMPDGDILGMAPPLCLTRAEADTIVEAVAGAVRDVGASL